MTSNPGMITTISSCPFPSSIIVGNGSTLPVTGSGQIVLPGRFFLNNVLIAPNIIKNLLSIRQFTTDNLVSIEFDPFSFSVKDLCTRAILLRCNSSEPLYTWRIPTSSSQPHALLVASSSL